MFLLTCEKQRPTSITICFTLNNKIKDFIFTLKKKNILFKKFFYLMKNLPFFQFKNFIFQFKNFFFSMLIFFFKYEKLFYYLRNILFLNYEKSPNINLRIFSPDPINIPIVDFYLEALKYAEPTFN